MHGEADTIIPVVHAHHTAEVVSNAALHIYPDHGHLSILSEVVPVLQDMVKETGLK